MHLEGMGNGGEMVDRGGDGRGEGGGGGRTEGEGRVREEVQGLEEILQEEYGRSVFRPDKTMIRLG